MKKNKNTDKERPKMMNQLKPDQREVQDFYTEWNKLQRVKRMQVSFCQVKFIFWCCVTIGC